MVDDIDGRAEHVEVEAEDLDVDPDHVGVFGPFQRAALSYFAFFKVLGVDLKLDVEDRALVHEDRDGLCEAIEDLPDSITMSAFELGLLDLIV